MGLGPVAHRLTFMHHQQNPTTPHAGTHTSQRLQWYAATKSFMTFGFVWELDRHARVWFNEFWLTDYWLILVHGSWPYCTQAYFRVPPARSHYTPCMHTDQYQSDTLPPSPYSRVCLCICRISLHIRIFPIRIDLHILTYPRVFLAYSLHPL